MRKLNLNILVATGVAALLCSAAALGGDGVVMTSGARLEGEVLLLDRDVQVETAHGTLVVSMDAVASVTVDGRTEVFREVEEPAPDPQVAVDDAQEPPAEAVEAAPTEVAEEPNAVSAAAPQQPGPRTLQERLERRISVDFQDQPLKDVLDYLRETEGVSFAYRPSDLEFDSLPVNLTLHDVPLATVLDLALEGRGLAWQARDGYVRILAQRAARRLEPKVYDVRDLLAQTADRQTPAVAQMRQTTSPDYYRSQDWDSAYSPWAPDSGEETTTSAVESQSDRAYALAILITETVEPDSWAQPAVVVGAGLSEGYLEPYEAQRTW